MSFCYSTKVSGTKKVCHSLWMLARLVDQEVDLRSLFPLSFHFACLCNCIKLTDPILLTRERHRNAEFSYQYHPRLS